MDILPLRSKAPQAPAKFAGFDAIRAFAALGVVLLHACVPYLRHPMPGLAWPVRDETSRVVDGLFWGIELFIMPLFLVMAGIFAWRTLQRRGGRQLVKSRASRLLIPLGFGVLVVLPLDLYAWLLGWVSEGLVAPLKLRSLKFENGIDRDLWGLSHLWFLQYLFLYVVTLAAGSWLVERNGFLRRRLSKPHVTAAVLASVGVITLLLRPEVVWGFQHSFFPVPSKWIYSGTFFLGGALMAQHDVNLKSLHAVADRLAIPALLLSASAIALGGWHLSGGQHVAADVVLAVITTASAWLMTLWIIGVATKHVDRISVPMQYLAAASFWVYVIHHPFLGLIHTDLKWLLPSVWPAAKASIAFTLCVGFSLLMYEGLIRKSRLGQLLGFGWSFPKTVHDDRETERQVAFEPRTPSEIPSRRAA